MAERYYKYKPVSNWQQTAQMLVNQEIWASKYTDLNDPMEWFFTSMDKTITQQTLDGEKGDVKICALSKNLNYGLMWAMYADNHKGICLEVEIAEKVDENPSDNNITFNSWSKFVVEYLRKPIKIKDVKNNFAKAIRVKSRQWEHEQEVRFVKRAVGNCFLKVKITKVFLGVRMDSLTKSFIYAMKSYKKLDFEIIDLSSNVDDVYRVNYWNKL